MGLIRGRWAFGALLAGVVCGWQGVRPVIAEPVLDRALSDVRVLERKGCSLVKIGFNFRLRYQSHFPLSDGKELRIAVRPIDPAVAAAQISVPTESLRPPVIRQAVLNAIEFELNYAGGPELFLYFTQPVYFSVGQGGDFTSIVIAISGDKPSRSCKPDFPIAGSGSWATSVVPSPPPALRRRAAGAPLSGADKAEVAKTMAAARAALTQKKLHRAVQLLTKVLSYPENRYSREAQELLGLARERKGQLAHAKAEYEAYLARYPDGDGASRVRQRLDALLTAHKAPRTKLRQAKGASGRSTSAAGRTSDGTNWSVSGSLSQFYYRDESVRTFRDPSLPPDPNEDPDKYDVHQNDLLSSLDLRATWGNDHYEGMIRFSGSHEKSFADGEDDEMSAASLFFELAQKDWGLLTRAGRQTRNTGGVLGRFDGGLVSWQAAEKLRFNAVAGTPVRSRKDDFFDSDQFFYGASIDYGPLFENLNLTAFYIQQESDGLTDRQAVGAELRYFDQNKSAFATVDYDIHFDELNLAIFSGSWRFPDKSTLTLAADYRKSPFLLTSNALQGQSIDTLRALLGIYPEDQINQLALDRTATSQSATIGFSRPLNDMLQLNFNATWSNISGTPASGGVDVMPSTGDEFFYSAQLIGTNIVKDGDIFMAGLRYADRANADHYVLDLNTRYPVSRDFRVNPRLRLSYRENKSDDLTEFAVLPSLRMNYYCTRDSSLELEVGGRWSFTEQNMTTDEQKELFIIVGYRYDFYADERRSGTGGLFSWK